MLIGTLGLGHASTDKYWCEKQFQFRIKYYFN